ncbi:DNA primase large subunit [Wyeomyia smithii]|uniref:DNA primase large subunit n=1 Tax=Wyeomyia smithii TaxID=174621 RepID=UPI002467CA60|nr:DNA primase large subunit [Wyeomyia smithii]
MEFSRRNRLNPEVQCNMDTVLEWLLPHNVVLYVIPPMIDMTISEFESLALERLKVLRVLEQASVKNLKPMSEEWRDCILNELNHEGLKHYVRLCQGNHSKEQDIAARRKDYLSHFILRFAYCRSEELKRWFIAREMELFRLKFSGLSAQDTKEFVQQYEMNYIPLSSDEKNEIKEGLYDSTVYQSIVQIEAMDFYKVRFTDVLDLVRSRKCYLNDGFAYVCSNDFISIIANKHLQLLEDGLQAHLRLLPELENDERFSSLLKGLHTSYTGKDYTVSKAGDVPIDSLDQLSKKSFPLCMRYCHDTLRAQHKLKHGGRMQYGLFLKGIGVTLEGSLQFFREEFSTRGTIPLEKYEKEYAYNIRHNYGKEGSRINYTPYSCMKIITSSVGIQDTHGCPFKIWEPSTLKTKLGSYGLSAVHVEEIISYASKGHYQIACGKYYETIHQTNLEEGIKHPNQFFEFSQITMGARAPKAKPTPSESTRRVQSGFNDSQDTSVLNGDDDDELWQLMEANDRDAKECETKDNLLLAQQPKLNGNHLTKASTSEWGEDDGFDASLVGME